MNYFEIDLKTEFPKLSEFADSHRPKLVCYINDCPDESEKNLRFLYFRAAGIALYAGNMRVSR